MFRPVFAISRCLYWGWVTASKAGQSRGSWIVISAVSGTGTRFLKLKRRYNILPEEVDDHMKFRGFLWLSIISIDIEFLKNCYYWLKVDTYHLYISLIHVAPRWSDLLGQYLDSVSPPIASDNIVTPRPHILQGARHLGWLYTRHGFRSIKLSHGVLHRFKKMPAKTHFWHFRRNANPVT